MAWLLYHLFLYMQTHLLIVALCCPYDYFCMTVFGKQYYFFAVVLVERHVHDVHMHYRGKYVCMTGALRSFT